jgi:DNA invertase Pin-like site-specific DNA recombinase
MLVTRLDPLARSTRDLPNILAKISKAGAQFKSLRETRLMVTIVGGIADYAAKRAVSQSIDAA